MVTPGRFCKSGISKILVIAGSLDVLIGCRLSEPFYLNLIFFTKCLLPEQIEGSHLNIWDPFQVKWKVEYQSKIKSLHCNTQPEIFNFLFCIFWVVFKLFAIIFSPGIFMGTLSILVFLAFGSKTGCETICTCLTHLNISIQALNQS